MNNTQKDLLGYMKEVLQQEDVHYAEAWGTVKFHIMDALDTTEDYDALLARFEAIKEHVSNICKAAGDQPSIATGYMRDVLDKFNGDL